MSGRVDWRGLMRLGLGHLRLSPDAFWSMTPTELGAALGWAGDAAAGRPTLERLMAAYPDVGGGRDEGRGSERA